MNEPFILSIDQGTSGTKTVIFDDQGRIVAKASEGLKSYFPETEFVEQDPLEIYQNVLNSVKKCIKTFRQRITACGISNQRETFLLWDKEGNPLSRAVVWQCKRSIAVCENLKKRGIEREVTARTGLIIDPYFSGTKVIWLNKNDTMIHDAISRGKAYFGTIDTWILYKLTKGKNYYTDYTNASRTLFFNINNLQWDEMLLREFHLQNLQLPKPKPSSYPYGETDFEGLFPYKISISAMIGDSHAAAFGEGCFFPGTAKATLGTGSSILMNTGDRRSESNTGMVSTICWSRKHRVDYALEGIIVTAGATIKWLRDQLGFFGKSKDTEEMARAVENNGGVYLVPAFSGLGAPYWRMDMKAAIFNLTFACNKNHIVRAALESIPFQIKDVVNAIETDSGIKLRELKVDGGITANLFVMQFLADLLNVKVTNIGIEEVSALGASYLAGLEVGVYNSLEQLESLVLSKKQHSPCEKQKEVFKFYEDWKKNVKRLL